MPKFEGLTRSEAAYLESLIRRVEGQILAAGSSSLANPFTPGTELRPTNLAVTPNVNRIQLRWAASSSAQVRYYEVQFADDAAFSTNLREYQTNELVWNFEEGDPGQTYYARVRAFFADETFSTWSLAINTETGLVLTEHLAPGAATNPVVDRTEIFSPSQLSHRGGFDDNAAYGSGEIETLGDSIILPFVSLQMDWTKDPPSTADALWFDVHLRRDAVRIGDVAETLVWSTGNGSATVGGPMLPDVPGDGEYVYDVEIDISEPYHNAYLLEPQLLVIELVELRR